MSEHSSEDKGHVQHDIRVELLSGDFATYDYVILQLNEYFKKKFWQGCVEQTGGMLREIVLSQCPAER